MGFTPSLMFDSTISKENKRFPLLMALSTRASFISRIFSLLFPGLDLRGLGGGSGVKVSL